jgi:hypothetical protein
MRSVETWAHIQGKEQPYTDSGFQDGYLASSSSSSPPGLAYKVLGLVDDVAAVGDEPRAGGVQGWLDVAATFVKKSGMLGRFRLFLRYVPLHS